MGRRDLTAKREAAMSGRGIGRSVLALVIGLTALASPAAAGRESGITVQLFRFKPGRLEVGVGTRLTWTNQDDIAHTVTSGTPERPDGRFDLALTGRGATGAVAFAQPGAYPYFCNRHQSMRGEIQVK
jgi:plastocyanin